VLKNGIDDLPSSAHPSPLTVIPFPSLHRASRFFAISLPNIPDKTGHEFSACKAEEGGDTLASLGQALRWHR